MKRLLAITMLSLTCFSVNAEWTPVLKGIDHKSSIDVDRGTFKRNGDTVKLWTRWDYDTDEYFGSKKYRSTVSFVEINCKEDMARTVFVTLYAGQKGEGRQIEQSNQPHAEFYPMPPDSMMRGLAKWACQ